MPEFRSAQSAFNAATMMSVTWGDYCSFGGHNDSLITMMTMVTNMVTDLGDHDVDDDHILTMVTGALDVPKKWPMTAVIGFESCLAPAEYDYDSC